MGSKSWVRCGGVAWVLSLGALGHFAFGCAEPVSAMGDPAGDDFPGGGKAGTGPVTDFRAVVTAERTPPPISGGTLIALREPGRAVVADPDRDRIAVVDYRNLMKLGEVATLRDRFDPACGGTDHGHAELLDEAGLDDLVAYLETL